MSKATANAGKTSSKSPFAVYGRLVRDKRVPHGAFRQWHILNDYANEAGIAWPSQGTIAKEIRCKPHSLKDWTDNLVEHGYLKIRRVGQNHRLEYQLLDGQGRPFSRHARRGIAAPCPKRSRAMPEGAGPRTSQRGIRSNPIDLIPRSNGHTRERWQIEKDVESVERQIARAKAQTGRWKDKFGVWHPNAEPTPEAQRRIEKLRARKKSLEGELDALEDGA